MFRYTFAARHSDAVLAALDRSLAIIEFTADGTILKANATFCNALGYERSEIEGRHHSMFVEPAYAASDEYRAFWAKLGRGEFDAREYKRLAKGGREIWIQASYNPIVTSKGAVAKVVKVATDITAEKLRNAEFEAKLEAISRVQAVIEFSLDGEILTANENFLSLLGYRLDEIEGRHHRLFVEPGEAQSPAYAEFWAALNRGEHVSASFKRLGKGGKEVWIQASYNPIRDMNGRILKVVKFASDITDLTEIGSGLARLAENDLAQAIDKPFSPTFEKLRLDFNSAHGNLAGALTEIADGANTIHAGTQRISSANDDLSRRTEQQAATLEETAAALDEITATVKNTAEGTQHARAVVTTAKGDAEASGLVVRRAIEAMNGIETSSRQIGQIISVIDEIAFQTNLLALNAGVEAARAGDAGRGFAVVASEVRALAQRSAEAAKEIKSLIAASTLHVAEGVQFVGETGRVLEDIVRHVAEIDTVVTDIAASAQEQATALRGVNAAVNQMDQVTQQNAVMVDETTAAGKLLSQETERLSDMVGQFRLEAQTTNASRRELELVAPQRRHNPYTEPSRQATPIRRLAASAR